MAALVIKKLPDHIHKAVKVRTKANHRSVTQEVVAALESLYLNAPSAPHVPMKLRFKITDESFNAAKRKGLN